MPEKFIIKREWKNSIIRVGFDKDSVYIEADIDVFAERLVEALQDEIPVNDLRYSIREASIKEHIEKAIRRAWEKVTLEMQEETHKVI